MSSGRKAPNRSILSRTQITKWIEDTSSVKTRRIEEISNGVAVALIMHKAYSDFSIKKIDRKANTDYAKLRNWKVIQSLFSKHKILQETEIEQLVKGSRQVNYEFLQKFKQHIDNVSAKNESENAKEETNVTQGAIRSELVAVKESEVQELEKEIEDLTKAVEELEQERNYYYIKLRRVEMYCQNKGDESKIIQDILAIL